MPFEYQTEYQTLAWPSGHLKSEPDTEKVRFWMFLHLEFMLFGPPLYIKMGKNKVAQQEQVVTKYFPKH